MRAHGVSRKFLAAHEALVLAALLYALITLALFLPVTADLTRTVANYAGNPDLYQNLWNLWWVKYSVLTLHASPYFTGMLFYPTGADLATQTLQPLSGLLTIPLQYASLVLAYNFVFLLGFVLAGLSMYLLADHVVRNKYAAFVAGLIFAFSSVHIAQSFTHLQWVSIEWMPLFILLLLRGIESKKGRHAYAFGAAASFLLTTFMGDIEQGVMVVVFALLFLYFDRELNGKRAKLAEILSFLAEVAVIVMLVGLPFAVPIAKSLIYSNALGLAGSGSNLSSSLLWSDNLLSFFVPSYFNGLFGVLKIPYQGLGLNDGYVWEETAYIGYSVVFLSLLGIVYSYKRREFAKTSLWLSLFLIFAALSLGPLVFIGKNYYFPGIYVIYYLLPAFNVIREPGRFDVIAELCLAMLSAYGLKYLLLEKNKGNERARNVAYTAIIALVVLIECAGIPYFGSLASALFYSAASTGIPQAYSYIGNSGVAGTVLVLPQNASPLAMYYQTEFERPIVNGYVTRESDADYANAQPIPLVSSCNGYGGAGTLPGCDYPILENYTPVNRLLLSVYNVSFIVLMKNAYGGNGTSLAAESLDALARPAFSGNGTTVFEVDNYTVETSGPLSYISGPWLAGAGGFWFAGGGSGIVTYSPGSGNVGVEGAMTSLANLTVTFYVDGEETCSANLEKGLEYGYAFQPQMRVGYNRINFTTNSSAAFVFGIRNTTIGGATHVKNETGCVIVPMR
jgi:hypothetical protein